MSVTFTNLERREFLERRGTGTEAFVRFPGEKNPVIRPQRFAVPLRESVPVAAMNNIADAPKLIGLRDRQWPQHHLLYQRKNRRSRSDAEREGEDSYGGETG